MFPPWIGDIVLGQNLLAFQSIADSDVQLRRKVSMVYVLVLAVSIAPCILPRQFRHSRVVGQEVKRSFDVIFMIVRHSLTSLEVAGSPSIVQVGLVRIDWSMPAAE